MGAMITQERTELETKLIAALDITLWERVEAIEKGRRIVHMVSAHRSSLLRHGGDGSDTVLSPATEQR